MYKAECPVPDVTVWASSSTRPGAREVYTQCAEFRDDAMQRIRELRPAAVVLAYQQANTTPRGSGHVANWLAGLRQSVTELKASGASVIQMGNNPILQEDAGLCLSRPGADPARCVGRYTDPAKTSAELQVVRAVGGTGVDVAPWFCLNDRCPAIVGRWIAYANDSHLSSQYVKALLPLVAEQFRSAGLR
jgi:hypothetical protein